MNGLFKILLTLAVFCSLSTISAAEERKTTLTVDVYYESLCPDSIYFITKELAPVYKELKDFLKINFIPFGKAMWVTSPEGKEPPVFMCQHGPNECRGNRAHACALNEIEQTLKLEDQQQKMVDIIDCAMSNRNPASAVPQCAEKNGFNTESIQRITECTRNNLGNELFIKHGEKTNAYQSPLSFVPSIVINGVAKPEAFRNFGNTICQLIPDGERPNICAQYK